MAAAEVLRAEHTTQALVEAWGTASFPTPFHPERGNPQLATTLRARVNGLGFAPLWGRMFIDYQMHRNNPFGPFAKQVFEAAEIQEGPELRTTVGEALGRNFPKVVLEAEIDDPILAAAQWPERPSPLAQFLLDKRSEVDAHPLSPTWVQLAQAIASEDPKRHDQVLRDMTHAYNAAGHEFKYAKAEAAGYLGGPVYDEPYYVAEALSGTLGRHFPDVVISQLKEFTPYPGMSREAVRDPQAWYRQAAKSEQQLLREAGYQVVETIKGKEQRDDSRHEVMTARIRELQRDYGKRWRLIDNPQGDTELYVLENPKVGPDVHYD